MKKTLGEWQVQYQFRLVVNGPEARLLILTSPGPKGWVVMAIEGPYGDDSIKDAQNILNNHSHAVLPRMYKTEKSAKLAAEKYALSWLIQENALAKCGCGSVKAKKAASGEDVLTAVPARPRRPTRR